MANSNQMDYTEDASKILDKILEEYHDKPLTIFKCRMTNYTPFMPGDFDTATFHCQNNKCYPTKPVLSQQLKGRMRWLARIVLADIPECSSMGDLNYRRIEEECLPVKLNPRSRQGSSLEMGLIQFMFGTLRAKGGRDVNKSFASPFKINIYVNQSKQQNLIWDPSRNSKWNIYKLLSKDCINRNRRKYPRYPDRYSSLLSLGKKDKRVLGPITPGQANIDVEVSLEPFALNLDGVIKSKNSLIELKRAFSNIVAFYIGLSLTVPTIFGLGKAANRGFGRFKLLSSDFESCILKEPLKVIFGNANKIYNKLSNLYKNIKGMQDVSKPNEAENYLKFSLKDLYEMAYTIARSDIKNNTGQTVTLRRVPSLISSIEGINNGGSRGASGLRGASVVESCIVNNNIDDAIELIGACTLKHVLKCFHPRGSNQQEVVESVWVLGLPRKHCWKERRNPRRQSMFILFPLPKSKFIVILPLYAKDAKLQSQLGDKCVKNVVRASSVIYDALENCLNNCNKGNKGGRK